MKLAQLVRARDCQSQGRHFDSGRNSKRWKLTSTRASQGRRIHDWNCRHTSSPCPLLNDLWCPDRHPQPWLRSWLYQSSSLPLRMDLPLLRWQPEACALAVSSSGRIQSLFGLIGEGPACRSNGKTSSYLRSQVLRNHPPPITEAK